MLFRSGLLFAWSAAHLPVAILWWSPLMPNPALVVPLQAAGLIAFVLLAATVLSTVTGATVSHAAITAAAGLAVSAVASNLFANSGNLLYLFGSPWLLYLAYQRFGGDIQALGGGWLRAIHPEDRESVRAAWELPGTADAALPLYHRLLRPDGTERWVVRSLTPITDTTGRPAGFIGTLTDITELRQLQDKLVLNLPLR